MPSYRRFEGDSTATPQALTLGIPFNFFEVDNRGGAPVQWRVDGGDWFTVNANGVGGDVFNDTLSGTTLEHRRAPSAAEDVPVRIYLRRYAGIRRTTGE